MSRTAQTTSTRRDSLFGMVNIEPKKPYGHVVGSPLPSSYCGLFLHLVCPSVWQLSVYLSMPDLIRDSGCVRFRNPSLSLGNNSPSQKNGEKTRRLKTKSKQKKTKKSNRRNLNSFWVGSVHFFLVFCNPGNRT